MRGRRPEEPGRPDFAGKPEETPVKIGKPEGVPPQRNKLQNQFKDWVGGPGVPYGLRHMPDHARERSGIEGKEPYTRERSGERGFARGRPDDVGRRGFGGRPDFAGRRDFSGRPDFAQRRFGEDGPGESRMSDRLDEIRRMIDELTQMLYRLEG